MRWVDARVGKARGPVRHGRHQHAHRTAERRATGGARLRPPELPPLRPRIRLLRGLPGAGRGAIPPASHRHPTTSALHDICLAPHPPCARRMVYCSSCLLPWSHVCGADVCWQVSRSEAIKEKRSKREGGERLVWTRDEDEIIIQSVAELGHCWRWPATQCLSQSAHLTKHGLCGVFPNKLGSLRVTIFWCKVPDRVGSRSPWFTGGPTII